MKRKKPPTLRSEIASLRRAMLHQVKATRGLTDAQQINTRKLNELLRRDLVQRVYGKERSQPPVKFDSPGTWP